MRIMTRSMSPFTVTKIRVITGYIVTVFVLCTGEVATSESSSNLDSIIDIGTTYPNGAVHDFHPEITYPHFRFEPFVFNPLVIDAGANSDTSPKHNPRWQGMMRDRMIFTHHWYVPYPDTWTLTDNGIAWVVANLAIDGNLNQMPDYIEFDYNCDGHVDLSDLSWFGQEYGDGRRWDLSDFSAMGTIYAKRRAE